MEAGFTTQFTHKLGDQVTVVASGESGTVHGRAEYDNAEPSYFVRYKAADGRATEAWWHQSALVPVNVTAEA